MQNDNNPFYDERGNLKIIDHSKQGLMKIMVSMKQINAHQVLS